MSKVALYREITKQTAIYGIIPFLRSASGFLLLPVFTRYLTPTDYGIMDLLDVALTITSLFFGMRLGEAMLYFYFNEETEERRNIAVTTTFVASALSGALTLALGWVISPQLSRLLLGNIRYAWYVRLMFMGLGVTFMGETGLTYLRGMNKSGQFTLVNTIRMFSNTALVLILLIGFHMTVAAFLWASIISSAGCVIYLYAAVLRTLPLAVDFGLLWKEVKYSFPLACQGLTTLVANIGDRVFLRRSVSLGEIGTYALAYKFGMMVDMVRVMFDTYWQAQSFAIMKRENARDMYSGTCTYLFFVLGTITTGMVVFLRPAMRLLIGPKFAGIEPYVPWLAAAYLIRAMAGYLRTVMRTENQTRWEGWVAGITGVVCIAAYATLIPAFHVWGAVEATGIAFLVMLVSSYWFAQRVKRHDFEWGRLSRIAAAGVFVSILAQVLPPGGWIYDVGVSTGLMLLYFLVLVGSGFLNADEKRLLRRRLGALGKKAQAYRAI
jgi:O-antigen/teichoic acid export membrane protein